MNPHVPQTEEHYPPSRVEEWESQVELALPEIVPITAAIGWAACNDKITGRDRGHLIQRSQIYHSQGMTQYVSHLVTRISCGARRGRVEDRDPRHQTTAPSSMPARTEYGSGCVPS